MVDVGSRVKAERRVLLAEDGALSMIHDTCKYVVYHGSPSLWAAKSLHCVERSTLLGQSRVKWPAGGKFNLSGLPKLVIHKEHLFTVQTCVQGINALTNTLLTTHDGLKIKVHPLPISLFKELTRNQIGNLQSGQEAGANRHPPTHAHTQMHLHARTTQHYTAHTPLFECPMVW